MPHLLELDTILREAVATGAVQGVVAAAATGSGVFHESAFGVRDPAGGARMAPDSVFALASMTKAVTCAAAMQLVEQGHLSLDGTDRGGAPGARRPAGIRGLR